MDTTLQDLASRYGIEGAANLIEDKDFGLVNGRIAVQAPHSTAIDFGSVYAPPYLSNFSLGAWVCGEAVKTTSYSWLPFQLHRKGSLPGVEVESTLTLITGERALILEVKISNTGSQAREIPFSYELSGGVEYKTEWHHGYEWMYGWPPGGKPVWFVEDGLVTVWLNDTGAVALGASESRQRGNSPLRESVLDLQPGQSRSFWLALSIGEFDDVRGLSARLIAEPADSVKRAAEAWAGHTARYMERFPRFSAGDKRLETFYDRSALHLLLNRWEVPEFIHTPHYSTGAINAGSMGADLREFGAASEIFPVVDAESVRRQLSAFLSIDLTRHSVYNPLSGAGWWKWRYTNQEQIVLAVLHYVLHTGDTAFLQAEVRGRTVLEWAGYHALWDGDGRGQDGLVDYGIGNHHLELRGSQRYDNILPDVNARRYNALLAAAKLYELAGREAPADFAARAEEVRAQVDARLWSEDDKWWRYLDAEGQAHLRLTSEMLQLTGSGAVSAEQEQALIGRLNENEFLGPFGLHSLSLQDPAYNQADLDYGGGGSAAGALPRLIEKLYRAGYSRQADDLLGRILWWGERLPYWSEALPADFLGYDTETPLQGVAGAASGAQAIIFGLFGVRVENDGGITVQPAATGFEGPLALRGLKLRGQVLDIEFSGSAYQVRVGQALYSGVAGEPVTIPAV